MKSTYYLFLTCLFLGFQFNTNAQEDAVMKVAEEMPLYGDCSASVDKSENKACSDKAVYEFIASQVVYPETAQLNGTEGTVVIRFVVDKEGKVKDVTVVKDIGDGCGDEAVRVVSLMENWKPATHKGKNVDVQMHLPVKFKTIPVKIRTEKFEVLSDLFCTNYLTDFVKLDAIHAMADDELVPEDLCSVPGVTNGLSKLKMTLVHDDMPKSVESEDGSISPTMRKFMEEAVVGDVIELEYELRINMDGENNLYKEVYKSVIIE